jgi:hypothetical protein
MNNDAGDGARENPLAFAGGFILKVSMEHLNKSVAIHIDKWLDMLVDHKHPPERRSGRALTVARPVNSAFPSELDLVDQTELHAFVEFILRHPHDRASQQFSGFGLLELRFQNWPEAAASGGGELHEDESVMGDGGLCLDKNGGREQYQGYEPGEERRAN